MVFGTLIGVGILTMGWMVLYGTVVQYRSRMLIEETPTQPIRSISLGRAEVNGAVEPVDDALASPFSKEDCVLYRYTVARWVETDDGESGWVPVEVGSRLGRFYLNDGTGRLLVDPAEAEVDLERRAHEFDEGEPESEGIRSFLDERTERITAHEEMPGFGGSLSTFLGDRTVRYGDAEELIGDESQRRRYTEEFLPVGEELYVFGQATAREGVSSPNNPENVVIQHDDTLPAFRISTESEEELVESTNTRIKWGIVAGALLAGMGFVWLLVAAGWIVGVMLTPLSIGVGVLLNRFVDLSKVRVESAN